LIKADDKSVDKERRKRETATEKKAREKDKRQQASQKGRADAGK